MHAAQRKAGHFQFQGGSACVAKLPALEFHQAHVLLVVHIVSGKVHWRDFGWLLIFCLL